MDESSVWLDAHEGSAAMRLVRLSGFLNSFPSFLVFRWPDRLSSLHVGSVATCVSPTMSWLDQRPERKASSFC